MADLVLADELGLAVLVALIDADGPGGQAGAQARLAGVGEVDHHHGAGRVVGADEAVGPVLVDLVRGDLRRVEEADLLGLVLGDRGAQRQGVDVQVAEIMTGAGIAFHAGGDDARARIVAAAIAVEAAAVDLAGDKLGVGVLETGARGVVQGDPALQVELFCLLVEQDDIVGLPRQAGGQIAEGRQPRPGVVGIDHYRQGRFGAQVFGHLVEDHPRRQAIVAQHLDAITDLQHHALVGGQHGGGLGDLGAVAGIGADDANLLADRLLHQLLRGQQVVVEVLFVDGDAGGRQGHRLGPDGGGDVLELQHLAAARDLELAGVLHQGQIVVVDGHRQAGRVGRAGHAGGQGQDTGDDEGRLTHARLPMYFNRYGDPLTVRPGRRARGCA